MFYEPFIRRAAGLGAGTYESDPDRYETRHEFADVLVVGSGPAGLSAALAAGRSGARVVLVEQDSLAGGSLLSEPLDGPFEAWRAGRLAELDALHNVSIRLRTTALGLYDGNTVGAGGAAGPSPARSGQGRSAPGRRHAPRPRHRAGDGRCRAASHLHQQRPARRHAGLGGAHLSPSLRRRAHRPRRDRHQQRLRLSHGRRSGGGGRSRDPRRSAGRRPHRRARPRRSSTASSFSPAPPWSMWPAARLSPMRRSPP